jgi:hypothetical protein
MPRLELDLVATTLSDLALTLVSFVLVRGLLTAGSRE